jgi:hypothetical protein
MRSNFLILLIGLLPGMVPAQQAEMAALAGTTLGGLQQPSFR